MQAVDVYLMYCALKAHFGKGDYDFVKYGGKSSATKDSFWKRTDRLFFVKTQRKYKKKLFFHQINQKTSLKKY